METEELIKLVDGIYKNILDKFNPGARQMITAGKAYLKALHGAAAASRLYVDAISKLARQAQQGTWGGSSDVGAALMKIVEVYKEIQDQQMNILKAFYVDLLVPLETNLEKDTKVVQSEQKRFLQQHKQRAETYSKAAAMMKKQRKKSRSSTKTGLAMDKELKNMQVLEEEKTKLDAFCEQSLKNAMTQERRRYGFVLERQCSLAKHHLSYHSQGVNAYQQNIEKWSEVAKTREFLPDSVENIFTNRLRNISVWQDDDVYSNPRSPNFEDDRMSITSQLRKTKSMDASCLDIRSIGDVGSPVTTMSRAKSEYNLNSSTHSLIQDGHTQPRRPKSMAVPPPPQWDTQLARALYAYLSSGENQLSFLEGDLIALIGERNKGWQFGENLRTQCSGWFPLAYTEFLDETNMSPSHKTDTAGSQSRNGGNFTTQNNPELQDCLEPISGNNTLEKSHPRIIGEIHLHRSSNNAKQIRRAIGSNNIPPPQLPAPVPTPSLPYQKTGLTQSQSTNFASTSAKSSMDTNTFQSNYTQSGIKSSASSFNIQSPTSINAYSTHPQPTRSDRPTAGANLPLHLQTKGGKIGGPVGNVSLHSSNDSGFSNDPPPQPEIDYSDDDSIPGQTKLPNRSSRKEKKPKGDKNNNTLVRGSPVRHSQSHGSLVGKQYYMASDAETLGREHKHLVKRTKSFWKFGKTNSDSEILEGMALWRHRDLVDVNESKTINKEAKPVRRQETMRRDRSNDSDRTINNNNNNVDVTEPKQRKEKKSDTSEVKKDTEKRSDFTSSSSKHSKEKNNFSYYNEGNTRNIENQFYDDEDGLMLKVVNRKNILQQYDNDSTEIDSESDINSDDPYDSILIEDQNFGKNSSSNFPNVAEIGKKLEEFSKTSKFSPNKESHKDINLSTKRTVSEKNKMNSKQSKERRTVVEDFDNDIIEYPEKRYSFRTFRQEDSHKKQDHDNKFNSGRQNQNDKSDDSHEKEKRSYYKTADSNRNNTNNRRPTDRPSYEDIESNINEQNNRNGDSRTKANRRATGKSQKCERSNYYDSTNDESDTERQFLPRTKLSKTNSNVSKYEENDLMGYGETLQRRLKNSEFRSQFDEKSPQGGNMYGPWYDLWGLDATARK